MNDILRAKYSVFADANNEYPEVSISVGRKDEDGVIPINIRCGSSNCQREMTFESENLRVVIVYDESSSAGMLVGGIIAFFSEYLETLHIEV